MADIIVGLKQLALAGVRIVGCAEALLLACDFMLNNSQAS